MNQTMQLLNGDSGLFFRNKINQLERKSKDLYKDILKMKGKIYKRNFDVIYNGITPKTITKEFSIQEIKTFKKPIKNTEFYRKTLHLKLNNQRTIYIYLSELNELECINY